MGYRVSMPAIAGIVYPELFEVGQLLHPMLNIMRHRGANPLGSYVYHQLQLGCTGTELISNERHSIWACLDGSLHNRDTLIQTLESHGYSTTADCSDAQLLIWAYGLWGADFCQHLEGHFSLVVFDQKRELLYVVRDGIGCKPLYWYQGNGHVIFASELKGILCTGIVPQVPDREAQGDYCLLGYTPQDVTAIRGINRLLPGHYLTVSLKGSCSVHQYWNVKSCFNSTGGNWQETLEASAGRALSRLQSTAAQPGSVIGTGIGSEELTRSLQCYYGDQLKTYEERFLGPAAQTSCGPQHICISGSSLLEDLVSFVWHMDEPLADIRLLAHWKLAERAKAAGTTHLVTGSGYDDLFFSLNPRGCPNQRWRWFSLLLRVPSALLSRVLVPLLESISPRAAGRLLRHRVTNPEVVNDLRRQAMFTERSLRIAAPRLARVTDWDLLAQSFFHDQLDDDGGRQHLYNLVRSRLPDSELMGWDRATMVHGLPWEAPLLNPEMLSLLHRSPSFGKSVGHESHPLSYPWVREPEIRRALRLIARGTLVGSGLLNPTYVLQTIKKAHNNPYYTYPLWGLLILEIWNRLFIHNPMPSSPPKVSLDDFLRTPY